MVETYTWTSLATGATSGDKSCDATYSTCPMNKRVFSNPTNAETIGSITSWEACATKCKEKSSCLFWDWRDGDHATPNTCVLNEGFISTIDQLNTVAGNRECQSEIV